LLGWPFLAEIRRCASLVAAAAPDELWILRSNSQQWPYPPETNAEVQDQMNERTGNLSLNKELDVIQKVNDWNTRYKVFAVDHKQVNVRTLKMQEHTADELRYFSNFDRSRDFMDKLLRKAARLRGIASTAGRMSAARQRMQRIANSDGQARIRAGRMQDMRPARGFGWHNRRTLRAAASRTGLLA
jgi:hypothetical protein